MNNIHSNLLNERIAVKTSEAHTNSNKKIKKINRRQKRALLRLYRKGSVSEEYLASFGIHDSDYGFVYSLSRKNGLSRLESFYNAFYIHSLYRFDKSEKHVPDELKNMFSHPKGWYKNSFYTWENNFWSRLLIFLQKIPLFLYSAGRTISSLPSKIRKKCRRGNENLDNSFKLFVNCYRFSKKAAAVLIPVILAVPMTIYAVNILDDEPALEVYVNGEMIGVVESDDVIISARKLLEKNLSASTGENFKFDDEITYSFADSKTSSYVGETEIYSALYNCAKKYICQGYGLYVDNVLIAVCESRPALDRAVSDLEEQFKQSANFYSDNDAVRVTPANKITIVPMDVKVESLSDENEIRQMLGLEPLNSDMKISPNNVLYNIYYNSVVKNVEKTEVKKDNYISLTGVTTPSSYIVQSDMSSVMTTNIQSIMEVALNYVVTRTETVEETVPYSIERIESENYLLGSEKIASLGKDGYRIATYEVSYQNGEEISRELVDENIIKPVENRVIYVGTRIPSQDELDTTATGTFIMPYNNYLSSAYGIRTVSEFGTREFHNAWDIPGPYGSDIAVADGGVVESVGYTSGYGLHIIVDHENGYETVYAHLSKSLVEEGDRVGQGDIIANMGASGKVTGVHVHFEIRKDGSAIDPAEFLGEVEERY